MEITTKHKELLRLQRLPMEDRTGDLWQWVCDNAEAQNRTVAEQLKWEILCLSTAIRSKQAFMWENINWRGLY